MKVEPEPSVASLAALREATNRCRECPIGEFATQSVMGVGPLRAKLMLVGERPGDVEDLRGRPFVGPGGQLLDRALADLGCKREQVYVTNAGRALQVRVARQAPHPQDTGAARSVGLPALAGGRDRAGAAIEVRG